ncbi:hypothetical protein OG992_33125 [Micromonospora sp. NBC_00362]|uniref:hypothetical protein n=1 Tax=Micromonospora sp. NBC_00362 TaxID=2975975 RepID=UPI0022534EC4|nr:hypothetical protein [Micromonospora sp. NBC_00362]MCX5122008.1 hypothetical protein [Micromonospora sp. NBC_00362]
MFDADHSSHRQQPGTKPNDTRWLVPGRHHRPSHIGFVATGYDADRYQAGTPAGPPIWAPPSDQKRALVLIAVRDEFTTIASDGFANCCQALPEPAGTDVRRPR